MKKYINRYVFGFTGAGLWLLSWVPGLLMQNRTGGILMGILGISGYVLMIVSWFLPWRQE